MCNLKCKGTDKTENNKGKAKILRFFINFRLKVLVVYKKVVPLHPQNRTRMFDCMTLGYGVMVTLQILVLSFLVRVRVPQQILNQKGFPMGSLFQLNVIYLFWASMALIFSRTRFMSSLSFCTLRFISSMRLLPFLELAFRNPRLFS